MEILFIYAEGCPDCDRMKKFLQSAIAASGKDVKIKQIDSSTREAIKIAVDHGIDDLPSCVIGDKIFQGKHFEYEPMEKAIGEL